MKRVEGVVGSVADFCPICRELRAFRFLTVERVSEVLFIPLRRTPLGTLVRCRECGATLTSDAARFESFSDDDHAALETLIAATRPDLRAEFAERLELEERQRRSPAKLDAAERARLLFEPFEALETMVRIRVKEGTHFDVYSGLGCLGALAAFFAGPALITQVPKLSQGVVGAFLLLALLLGIFTLFQFALNPGRSARRRVVPLLVRALAPLRPLQEEIALCLDHCRKAKWKIGAVVRVDGLWKELRARDGAAGRGA